MHHIQLLSYQQIELDASALWRFQQSHIYSCECEYHDLKNMNQGYEDIQQTLAYFSAHH